MAADGTSAPPSRIPVELLRGHDRFHRGFVSDVREFLRSLASIGQSPDALFIGCSDSRVVPELLTNSAPGSLFVLRNVANLAPRLEHPDASAGAALEYAVGHLNVPHVIVCGHYGCGGVKACMDGLGGLGLPSLQEWLEGAVPAVDRARAAVPVAGPGAAEALWRRAVEENVIEQVAHLASFPVVSTALAAGRLELHGWVYDLHSLELLVYLPDRQCFAPAQQVLSQT